MVRIFKHCYDIRLQIVELLFSIFISHQEHSVRLLHYPNVEAEYSIYFNKQKRIYIYTHISSRCSGNSEASASEFLEHIEDMSYIYNLVRIVFHVSLNHLLLFRYKTHVFTRGDTSLHNSIFTVIHTESYIFNSNNKETINKKN